MILAQSNYYFRILFGFCLFLQKNPKKLKKVINWAEKKSSNYNPTKYNPTHLIFFSFTIRK